MLGVEIEFDAAPHADCGLIEFVKGPVDVLRAGDAEV